MRPLPPLFALATLAACGEGDPMARTDDLPQGYRRIAVAAPPTAEEVASACFVRDREACRDDPETHSYCEPPEGDYLVREPRCTPVAGDPASVDCKFGYTSMPWAVSEEAYNRLGASDFEPAAARFTRVARGARARWLAATFCR